VVYDREMGNRSWRGKKKGQAVSFCSSDEKDLLSNIETFLGQEIAELEIERNAYRETLDFTKDTDYNWKKLIRDNEKELKEVKKKK
jgi:ATP-dependent RNA helicase RhlE